MSGVHSGGHGADAGPSSRPNILAEESWSATWHKYERVLMPRFAPWMRDALDALRVTLDKDEAEDEAEEGGAGSVLRAWPGATADREKPRIGMHGAWDRPRPPA